MSIKTHSRNVIWSGYIVVLAIFLEVVEGETRWELSWERPKNLPYPKVWHRFEAISKKTGCKHKIKIQDIPPDRFEEAIAFMEKHLDHHEPVIKAVKLSEDPESVAAFRIIRRKMLQQKISLMAAIDDEDDVNSKSELIGTLLLGVKSKNDPPTKQVGKALNQFLDLFGRVKDSFDPFQLLGSDRHIFHLGLSVASNYHGLGVGFELELQSSVVGKACDIRGSTLEFTSIYSQPFWEKLGCTVMNAIRYDEYKDENGEVIIPNVENGLEIISLLWKYS